MVNRVREERASHRNISRKGDCSDNAAMESFFHSLKVEQTEGKRYATREEAMADVFEYICPTKTGNGAFDA